MAKRYNVPAEQIWTRVGDPSKLADWHPFIARTESVDGGTRRVNTTADGGRVVETILEHADRHHTWRIDDGPLPYDSFVGTIRVRETGNDACVVECHGRFEPKGIDQQQAEELTRSFFEAGLDAIATEEA